MKRLSLVLVSVLVSVLSGCMSYGSWLDQVGKPPNPLNVMSTEHAVLLGAQAAQLRGQAESLRVRLASEGDRRQRLGHVMEHQGGDGHVELRRIGDRLHPIEAQLRSAGKLG